MKTKESTGYPSIDKPWLRYCSEDVLSRKHYLCMLYKYFQVKTCLMKLEIL